MQVRVHPNKSSILGVYKNYGVFKSRSLLVFSKRQTNALNLKTRDELITFGTTGVMRTTYGVSSYSTFSVTIKEYPLTFPQILEVYIPHRLPIIP